LRWRKRPKSREETPKEGKRGSLAAPQQNIRAAHKSKRLAQFFAQQQHGLLVIRSTQGAAKEIVE